MKFKVRAGVFADLLKSSADVANKGIRKDFESFDKLKLSATKEEIKLEIFGGYIGLNYSLSEVEYDSLDYKFEEPGSVVLDVNYLISVLKSFMPDTEIIFQSSKNNDEIQITDLNDESETQTLPIYNDQVTLPKLAGEYQKEITINKDIFCSAVNKIFFAVGFSKFQEMFLYWVLRTNGENNCQFASGTGSRFAVFTLEGDGLVATKNKKDAILFPKDQTPVMLSVLSNINEEKVTLKQSSGLEDTPNQIVIECGNINMILVGFNDEIKWVDESTFFKKDKTCKLTTKTLDWEYPMKGIRATYTEDIKRLGEPHDAFVQIEPQNSVMKIATDKKLKAMRKIPVLDIQGELEDTFELHCLSQYLAEVANKFEKGYCNQIEFINDKAPIVIHDFADEKVSDDRPFRVDPNTGLKEQFSIFFSVMVPTA